MAIPPYLDLGKGLKNYHLKHRHDITKRYTKCEIQLEVCNDKADGK
jgi:hypothetical protein